VPTGAKEEDILSQFWAAYRNHKEYEKRVIAANNAKRRKEAADQRAEMIAGVAGLSTEEVDTLSEAAVPVKMAFEGFAIDDEMAAALKRPVGAKPEEKKVPAPKPAVAA
jgi:hypothetical protein